VIELLLAAERMLSVGMLDQAERLFSQVAEADPKNAIAVVGLARVALERGDEAGALAEARRALEIDPEDDAARRLADRMAEVIATRKAMARPEAAVASAAAEVAPPEPTPAPPEPEPVRAEPEPAAPVPPQRSLPGARSWLDRLLGWFRRR
jgi:thioredoxin-like negative regulator of GroEL